MRITQRRCTGGPGGAERAPGWGDEAGRCGAITQWGDGACLYVNVARYRNGPSARYRNRFWVAADGGVLFSWFPGRGHAVTGAAVTELVGSGVPLLLFCRRAPSSYDYVFCGRLQPWALALPEIDGVEQLEDHKPDHAEGRAAAEPARCPCGA